jgi:hypothetical protein
MFENEEYTTEETPVVEEAPVTSVAGEPEPVPTDGTAEPDVPTNDKGEPIPDVQPGSVLPEEEKPEE